MSALTLTLCLALAVFGLLCAVAAWFILRFTVGAAAAMLGFYAVLMATCYSLLEIIQLGS